MPTLVVDKVWDEMYDLVGDDLRGVAGYEGLEYESRVREDIRGSYTSNDEAEFIDRALLDQHSERQLEEKFHAGKLHATIHLFDEAWLIAWIHPEDWRAGVLVSIQRDGHEASFEDVETCLEYLESEIEPQIESRYS